jgi:hypothetical protein
VTSWFPMHAAIGQRQAMYIMSLTALHHSVTF